MEAISLVASVLKSLEFVRSVVKESNDLRADLTNSLDLLKSEFSQLSSDVKEVVERNSLCTKPQEWILQLQGLAYDIEDFLYERGRDPKTPPFVQLLQTAIVTHPGRNHLKSINGFRERIKTILSCKKMANNGGPAATATAIHQLPQQIPMAAPEVPPPQPTDELVDLLVEADGGGHQNHVKVISILGRGGSGKTALARALYSNDRVMERFPRGHRAMIQAPPSSHHVSSTLRTILRQLGYYPTFWAAIKQKILQQLPQHGAAGNDDEQKQLKIYLQTFLHDKRYLIIIDGVEDKKAWDAIRAAFPDNTHGSRLVVTTSIRSIATGRSSGSYLYTMPRLNSNDSAELFWAKLGPENRQPALEEGLRTLFRKCDGLPLALLGTADYLSGRGAELNAQHCRDVGHGLGSLLVGEEAAFGETKASLSRCCDGVRKSNHKMCMLSVSWFPMGHRISRKKLIRKWIAEGLVAEDSQLGEDSVASGYLDDLLDLGIVEPLPCGNDNAPKGKWCQVHGVMLEFLLGQSASWNFTTVIEENRVVGNHETSCAARRLAVHGAARDRDVRTAVDSGRLSHIRSLITVRSTNNLMRCLRSCSRLRVLDLEACTWLGNDHLRDICKQLLHLRYLSLRRTSVSKLPKAIKDLHHLETLDVRQTGVNELPMEVIMLPLLAHLFGKFELPAQLQDPNKADELKKFFSQESNLQTLAGFKVLDNQGFELILQHASMLKKVKIWCELPRRPPPPPQGWHAFKKSIAKSFRKEKINAVSSVAGVTGSLVSLLETRFAGSDALDSLSVDFGDLCPNFLDSVLKDPCAVSSIKVCGRMATLPASSTLEKLRNIETMHLCNTGLLSEVLSGLQYLDCLVYLKLVENRRSFWEGSFVVRINGFRSLKQLCFDGSKIPDLVFEQESKCPLVTLQLICLEPATRLGVTGITHLQRLSQVILHPDAPPEKMDAWKQEAIGHRNRPYVVKKQPGSSDQEA